MLGTSADPEDLVSLTPPPPPQLVCLPTLWRVHIFVLVIICFLVLSFMEDVLLDNRKLWLWLKKLFKVKPGSNYKKMQLILAADREWPPVKRVEYATDPISEDIGCTNDVYCNPAFDNNEMVKIQG